MIKFEVGKTYYARSFCDYDCIYDFTIEGRTEKTLLTTIDGKLKTRRIKVIDGVETFSPFGAYSMSATIYANKEYKDYNP